MTFKNGLAGWVGKALRLFLLIYLSAKGIAVTLKAVIGISIAFALVVRNIGHKQVKVGEPQPTGEELFLEQTDVEIVLNR